MGLPGAALFNILLWTVWDGLQENSSAQFAYYLGCYCTLILFFTCFYIPYVRCRSDLVAYLDGGPACRWGPSVRPT